MRPLTEHSGHGVVLRRGDVDTDQIIPAEHCRKLTRTGYADALFARWRRDPGFVLNQPEAAGASVLLALANFGTGSSREHAVWALRDWGFVAVIAPSFGDIFTRNALRNGLLPVELPEDVVLQLCDAVEAETATPVTISLEQQEVRVAEHAYRFDVDSGARWLLLNGFDEIEVSLQAQPAIDRYERDRPGWLPVLPPAAGAP